MNRIESVYLVVQHQTSDPEFDNRTVYVCKTRTLADYAAAKLNVQYADNVNLDEDNQFVDIIDDNLDCHYYTVEGYAVEQDKHDIDEYDM